MNRWCLRGFGFAIVLAFVASAASADLYLTSGQHRFTVRVRNSSYKDVRDARGSVYVSGTQARIDVQAPGYREGYTTVYLPPNSTTTNHYADVRLDDPTVWIDVVDQTGRRIENSSVDAFSQSLYWGDEYGMRARFPKAQFTQVTERKIQVRVNYLWAFAPRVYLTDRGDYWALEVVIRRRDMGNSFSCRVELEVPRDPPAPPPPATETLSLAEAHDLVADYQRQLEWLREMTADDGSVRKVEPKTPALPADERAVEPATAEPPVDGRDLVFDRLGSLARQVRAAYRALDASSRADLRQALPAGPLADELRQIDRFDTLQP